MFAVPAVNVNVLDVGVVDKETPWYWPDDGSDILVPEGVHTSWMLPLSELVAVTVVVAVTLVPVVALLVDRTVETVETAPKTVGINNSNPTIETMRIVFLFIFHLWSEHISYIDKF